MKQNKILILFLVFIGLPLAIYGIGDFPRRSSLKELISVVTIVSFFVMILQFFLSRFNKQLDGNVKKSAVVRWHKVLGYIFITVLLVHPFLIVLPHYFSPAMSPGEAFNMILLEWSSYGVLMGIIAWVLMLVLGVLSYFRNSLKMKYTDWRLLHGILSVVFIIVASLHVISLGRHIELPMVVLIGIFVLSAVVITLRSYLNPLKK